MTILAIRHRGDGMSDTKHTPGIWRKGTLIQNDGSVAVMSDDGRVCRADTPEDAERIVLCCNCHDDLVAALKALRKRIYDIGDQVPYEVYQDNYGFIEQADAALAKAGEK